MIAKSHGLVELGGWSFFRVTQRDSIRDSSSFGRGKVVQVVLTASNNL